MSKKRKTKGKSALKKALSQPKIATLSEQNFWQNHWVAALLVFLLPFVFYWTSTSFGYVLDDVMVIQDNSFTKKGFAGIIDIFTTESFAGYFGEQKNILIGGRYRPLSIATFAAEYGLYGENPGRSHFLNILFYALTGVLIFRLVFMLLPNWKDNRWFLGLAFVTSLLFVMHPIHTEVVANIKGRDEILALLLSLGALYGAVRFVETGKIIPLIIAAMSWLLGILAKENAITWLLIIPLTIYYFRSFSASRMLTLLGTLGAVVLVYFGMRYNALGFLFAAGEGESTDIMNNPFYGLAADKKYATIFYTWGLYLKLLIFPHPLTHDYYPYQIPIIGFADWRALLSFVVNLGLGIYALLGIRKKTIVSYSILFYFITFSVVSNFVLNVGTTMNERFIYMPSLGFCLALSYFITRWLPAKLNESPRDINVISVGLLSLLLIGYSAKTLLRVPDWKDALSLNSAAVRFSPNSARANCFMGVALFEERKVTTDPARRELLLEQSAYYIDRSLALYPAYGSGLTMKAGVISEQYKIDNDIDKLLSGFEYILQYRTIVDFVNEYLEYLIQQRRSPEKVINFLYRVGYDQYFQRGNYEVALHYLNYAYQIDSSNKNVIQAIAQSYQNLGNSAKANEFQQKLR
jgi:tetratricopeptide (TPR) repeat protein